MQAYTKLAFISAAGSLHYREVSASVVETTEDVMGKALVVLHTLVQTVHVNGLQRRTGLSPSSKLLGGLYLFEI